MRMRMPIARLAALGLALTLALLPNLARAAPETNVCRRLWGTEEWTRRCRPDRPEVDPVAYCRRAWGTDEWSRRCARLLGDDPAAYCRRLWGTDEWTRRCAVQLPDPPNLERVLSAVPSDPAAQAARGPR